MTDKIQKALNVAEEALSQLASVAIGTEHGNEFKYQVDLALKALVDVREAKVELETVKKQMIEDSWRRNPDRSGGQFTQDEIDNSGRWI